MAFSCVLSSLCPVLQKSLSQLSTWIYSQLYEDLTLWQLAVTRHRWLTSLMVNLYQWKVILDCVLSAQYLICKKQYLDTILCQEQIMRRLETLLLVFLHVLSWNSDEFTQDSKVEWSYRDLNKFCAGLCVQVTCRGIGKDLIEEMTVD